MKLEIERAAFAEVVGRASKALAARPTSPVLSGLVLRAGEGRLSASGFDYEFAVAASAPAAVGEPGEALVSGRLLAEITRSLPQGRKTVELTADATHLVLRCGAYRYTLARMPLAEYPVLPAFPERIGRVEGAALASAAGQAAVAADRDETLPVLTGTRIEFEPGCLRLVATDRYRLARRDVPWTAQERAQHTAQETAKVATDAEAGPLCALVPARTLLEAARLLPGGAEITIGLGPGLLGLSADGVEVTMRQLDGAFIRYNQLFPEQYAGEAILEVAALTEAAKAIALVAERDSPLRLEFEAGEVTVSAGSGDHAKANVTIEAGYEGEPLVIAVRPVYLLDGLNALGTPHARLRFADRRRLVVLSGLTRPGGACAEDERFQYLFIPVRTEVSGIDT